MFENECLECWGGGVNGFGEYCTDCDGCGYVSDELAEEQELER